MRRLQTYYLGMLMLEYLYNNKDIPIDEYYILIINIIIMSCVNYVNIKGNIIINNNDISHVLLLIKSKFCEQKNDPNFFLNYKYIDRKQKLDENKNEISDDNIDQESNKFKKIKIN